MKQIRQSKFSKIVAYYLIIMMCLQVTQPMQMYALTSGPTQPEFNSFTPIGTSDMVDLTSGDFNYNIPIMDVGGYPLNLAYNSGITMDQEASWVGLGWNLNVGEISRQVRGLPDDFRGDEMLYENNLKQNRTVGVNVGVNGAIAGLDAIKLGVGLGVESNNYEGISFKPSFGLGFSLNKNVSVGIDFTSSLDGGATVSPRIGLSFGTEDKKGTTTSLNSSLSLGFNSRKGIENLNVSASVSQSGKTIKDNPEQMMSELVKTDASGAGVSGRVSFNNLTFTPSKRIGFRNENFSFSGAVGGEVWTVEGQVQLSGYGSYQTIADEYRNRKEKAYGYENTEYKSTSDSGILDFNRENERTVNENTLALPVTNYTYDIYNIEGQGVSGMFRPYRSKVSNVYNDLIVDIGSSNSFGIEIGLGNLVHGSGDFKTAPSVTSTGGWFDNNNVLPYFTERNTDSKNLFYEPTTFKMVGSMVVDPENIYKDKIYETQPLRIDIDGYKKNTYTKPYTFNNGNSIYGNSEIKRSKRYLRNQLVHKVTAEEAIGDKFIVKNDYAKPHHTAGIKVLKTDGSTYIYGNTVYNTKKIEATFDVSGQDGDNVTGFVDYNGSVYGNQNSSSDEFVNRITTPAYAHSHLLSSLLSSDYEDIDNNGPTINDLGSFTNFEYKPVPGVYKWRVPFEANTATYNQGLISKDDDQKGNYLYGEKELKYLDKIVTKTHVAFFDLEDRKDAIGVNGENGGYGNGRMQKLKSIRLYSRPEVTNASGVIFDPNDAIGNVIKPIKMAHFVYSYNLCKGMPNNERNNGINNELTAHELGNAGGKLTLEKVYFTYRGSNMGKYTPYTFFYGQEQNQKNNSDPVISPLPSKTYSIVSDPISNPIYNSKEFDIWGNYKKNPDGSGNVNSALSNTEFPFVEQNKAVANLNTAAWNLKAIRLPSGGTIKIETESDDYRYVQNKKAMQMFKVIGAGNSSDPLNKDNNTFLYNGDNHKKYIYVKISDTDISNSVSSETVFKNKYLNENLDKPIQFRFLLNMSDNASQYDYVSGYFKIDQTYNIAIKHDTNLGGTIASIPVAFLSRDKGGEVNPIAKAGWNFGRTFMNRLVCGVNDNPEDTDFSSIVENLKGSLDIITEIFEGPNGFLQNKRRARIFKPEKSWIRLENPDGHKLGGGLRVKSVTLSDNWSKMLDGAQAASTNDMEYGQTYSYDDESGFSSGVATFEPNMCAENPFVEPFYNGDASNYAESIAAPMESNYVEKPFGVNFFPAPRVTYSKVTVKNLDRKNNDVVTVKKHATGSVVTKHYTSFDFPTKVSNTDLAMINGITPNDDIINILESIIIGGNLDVRNLLTMSQGYAIETNDMNGKMRSQEVYDQSNSKISSVEYKYNIDENGDIDNNMTTIDDKGVVAKRLIGVDYDLINDFNRSYSETSTDGFKANLAVFLIPAGPFPIPIFIPTVFPESSVNVNELRTAVTTKHVHKTAIQVEKIAYDLGSTVSTKNLAWDASSGEVLLTQTINEYNDNYYSFNYPAYWMYRGMGLASQNIGIEGTLVPNTAVSNPNSSSSATGDPHFKIQGYTDNGGDLTKVFQLGDELYVPSGITQSSEVLNQNLPTEFKLWVVGFSNDKKSVLLMDRNGKYINTCEDLVPFQFKLTRSGYRNMQMASMASITSMINPIKITNPTTGEGTLNQNSYIYNENSTFNPRIINASAVVYRDFWNTQLESKLPYYPSFDVNLNSNNSVDNNGNPQYPKDIKVNPYVYNIKGDWKAEKSYAYLTGRNFTISDYNNPRNEGFFKTFAPFYQFDNSGVWQMVDTNWTYASSVTKMSPYGAELENKDALDRYSSAQYGYNYTLPMAVASNAKYEQIGYDGFEEFRTGLPDKHFGFDLKPEDLSKQQSHTGKSSVKVDNGKQVTLSRKLIKSEKPILNASCPVVVTPPVTPFSINYINLYGCENTLHYDINSCTVSACKSALVTFNSTDKVKYIESCIGGNFNDGNGTYYQFFLDVKRPNSGLIDSLEIRGSSVGIKSPCYGGVQPSGQGANCSIKLEVNGKIKYIQFIFSFNYLVVYLNPNNGGFFDNVSPNCTSLITY
jgi:hypothetical protein